MEWLADYVCSEVHGTRQERFPTASSAPSASVRLKCKYSERYEVIRSLLSTPAEYPFSDSICQDGSILYCTDANLVPNFGAYDTADSQVINYLDYSFVDCTYNLQLGYYRNPGSQSNNEYIEETLEPRMETMPLNNRLYQWGAAEGSGDGDGDPLSADETPVRYEPGVTYTRITKGVTLFDISWLDFQGTVHSGAFSSFLLGVAFPADTLLLRSMTAVREWSHLSYVLCYPTWTIQLKYEYKPQTWSLFWRGSVNPAGYYAIKLVEDNSTFLPFSSVDHSTLLFG